MRHSRRTLSAALGVVALAGVLAACGGGSGSGSSGGTGSGKSPTSATVAVTLQLASLNGLLENLVPLNDTIADPLVKINGDGSLAPGLATSWQANADATVWTFTLRKGVTYSDGAPFTASDVVWTYDQVQKNAESMNHAYVAALRSVTARGSDTVVFTLTHPYAAWPRQTSLLVIVPQKAYTAKGANAFARQPVGTGPYTVTGFDPGQTVTLKANPKYWGGAPAIGTVTLREIDTESTRLTALQSGSVTAAVLSPATARQAKGNSKLTVQSTASNVVSYLGFNVSSPGVDQLALRQAISMGVDRATIAATLFGGDAKPIGQLLAPSVFGYDPSLPVPTYDPAKAKALVARSGYTGQRIALTYPNGPAVPQAAQLAQAIQGYLDKIGVKTTLKQEPQATFVTDWFAKRLPGIYLFSIQPSTLDADLVFTLLCDSAAHFTDATVSADLTRQTTQTAESARKATLAAISARLNAEVYYAPLLNAQTVYVSQRNLQVTPRADGYLLPQLMK